MRLRISPEKTKRPLMKRRAKQKSIKKRKGVMLNINNKNAIADRRSIAPRTFSTALI